MNGLYKTHTYEGVRRLVYGEGATFVPVCAGPDGESGCGRFVRADETITFRGHGPPVGPHATCSRCGRVWMVFEGYV